MHCAECCLHLRMTKARTVPVHYLEDVPPIFGGWAQKRCPASGTTNSVDRVDRCARPRSRRECPGCGRKFTLNKNGKFPVHDDPDGRECKVSRDNRG